MFKTILTSAATVAVLSFNSAVAQDEFRAYQIYTSDGSPATFNMMVEALKEKQVVLFGEMHNNPIDHWLQLELTKALDQDNDLVLGAEMFERDDQVVLDEYILGKIKEDHFKKEAKLWPNYATDYKPLVEYAKAHNLAFIATNVPRRYASMVAADGQEVLVKMSKEARSFYPEVPFVINDEDSGYIEMRDMMGDHAHGMGIEKLIEAQALKDYTMADAIVNNRNKGQQFLHFNGSFHSHQYSGIYNYLKQADKDIDIGVIAAQEAESVEWNEEWEGQGDFIIVTVSNMTKTH